MTDHVEVNRRNWDERAAIHARDTTGDYMLDRFRAGEDALHAIEAAELGDIRGKRVLHLQCHIGRDTLCLVRRGAIATGLDFSSAALDVARRLSHETGLKADFVEGTVDQAPDLTPGPFDLVFTTWGTVCWLPDVKKWAEVIASVLVPGGELYFADAHPGFNVLEEYAGKFVPTHDFQTPPDQPLHFDGMIEKALDEGGRHFVLIQSGMSSTAGDLFDAIIRNHANVKGIKGVHIYPPALRTALAGRSPGRRMGMGSRALSRAALRHS